MLDISYIISAGLTACFFFIGYYSGDNNVLLISLLCLFTFCVLYAIRDLKSRIVYLLFLATFFIFLLGSYFIKYLSGEDWWGSFTYDIINQTVLCLILSLLFSYFGNLYQSYKSKNVVNEKAVKYSGPLLTNLLITSKMAYFVTYLPALYVLVNRIIYVRSNGYADSYINYSGVPLIISRLSSVNSIAFYLYLGCEPRKKDSLPIVALYILHAVLSLFTGVRGEAMTSLLVLFFYFLLRNWSARINNDEEWISRKTLLMILCISPVIVIFLSFWGYYRVGRSVGDITLSELFIGFFESQGGSVNILSYCIKLKDSFPDTNISYTFGPLINFFKYNIISKNIFNFPFYSQHTIGSAKYGNDLSQIITYIVMPWNYSKGIGMGSCYIGELLVDFGYIGICAFNFILGMVLGKYSRAGCDKPWKTAILLIVLKSILFMPRGAALSWFTDGFNITNVGTLFLLYFVASLFMDKKERVKLLNET